MGLSLYFTDAAHAVGLDDMLNLWPLAGAPALGPVTSSIRSWTAPLVAGQDGSVVSAHASGLDSIESFTGRSDGLVDLTAIYISRPLPNEVVVYGSGSARVPLNQIGTTAVFDGDDMIFGNAADNVLMGYGGNDTIDGGAGSDTAVIRGNKAQSTVAIMGGTAKVSGPDGNDTLYNIERIRFDDVTISQDVQGSMGQAFRMYQAAFNRHPDQAGLGFQVRALETGTSLKQLAANFMASPEFKNTYGSLDDASFMTTLYAHVLHRLPDAGGLAYYLDHLSHDITRSDVLVGFSQSPENVSFTAASIFAGITYDNFF
jgi:hypothetical protein